MAKFIYLPSSRTFFNLDSVLEVGGLPDDGVSLLLLNSDEPEELEGEDARAIREAIAEQLERPETDIAEMIKPLDEDDDRNDPFKVLNS